MIKNIIFDLGNVLVSFHPEKFVNENVPEIYREKFFQVVFGRQEWKDLDRGTLEYDKAIEIFSKELPECREIIKKMFDTKVIDCLAPITFNAELLKKLKENYKLYIISNFHYPAFDNINELWDFFKLFDGKVISGHCKLLKPEYEIYNLLLDTYNLKAEESLFIDDTKENIEAANDLGIDTIHLTSPNLLKEKLIEKGIIL
ncbi:MULTISPECIES: HAD family phosphatase [Fusobacterium]|uniref:HAD family hydrolase n=1 Tax=Fusobacterium TaxID=848 RepID=UPI00147741F1|nr:MULTISPECIES: HAD family phosphatase [Fusobacterium]NME35898.1 HAD family phosphatase [Fusobacterium sp. FSA-380-WT-3A]